MDIDSQWIINGHKLEYFSKEHLYLCDGIIIPSVTQIIKNKFMHKYDCVDKKVLKRASEKGTAVHKAIEQWCESGEESDLIELKNFKFLMKQYNFKILGNEMPVLLIDENTNQGICAGRLDIYLEQDNKLGLADIKRTSTLDKDYLSCQLNLYRLAFMQDYHVNIEFLKGIHLREDKRKYVNIPINEEYARKIIKDWLIEMNTPIMIGD